jgi:hypothetical protein
MCQLESDEEMELYAELDALVEALNPKPDALEP